MAPNDDTLQRTIGQMEGRLDALEDRMDRMEPKIDSIYKAVTEASGSVKVLLAVASVGAAIGGTLVGLFSYLKG